MAIKHSGVQAQIALFTLWVMIISSTGAAAGDTAVAQLLAQYREQGAGEFSAQRGAALWQAAQGDRSCRSCHSDDPTQAGSHQRTGKRIEPLAPSANPARLQRVAEIQKWLKRNCEWTLGRQCSAQEKGDFLTWLNQQ